jgi:hypothetical protein
MLWNRFVRCGNNGPRTARDDQRAICDPRGEVDVNWRELRRRLGGPGDLLQVRAAGLVASLERDLRRRGSADFGWLPLTSIIWTAPARGRECRQAFIRRPVSGAAARNHLLKVARRIRAPPRKGRRRFLEPLGGRCVRTACRLRGRLVAGRGERTAEARPRSRRARTGSLRSTGGTAIASRIRTRPCAVERIFISS